MIRVEGEQLPAWARPAKAGVRLEFGIHVLPRRIAESAPAWPPLEVAGRRDRAALLARLRRRLNR